MSIPARYRAPLIQIKASRRLRATFGACTQAISEYSMKAVSVEEAVARIPNGATVMVGGFMGVGTPERLLDELVRQRKSELSIISNDAAVPGKGVGKLFDASLVATLTASHIGLNPNVQKQMMANKVAVDLVPQGTLRRTHPRRRLRPRRRADADRRRHHRRGRQTKDRSTARTSCLRPRFVRISR